MAWAIVHAMRPEPARIERALTRAQEFSWSESARRHAELYRQARARAAAAPTAERSEIHA
jgi:glycogen synthase